MRSPTFVSRGCISGPTSVGYSGAMTSIYRSLPLTGFLAFALIAPAFAQTAPPAPEAEKPDAAATPSEADKKREAVKKAAIKKTVLKRLGNETPADAKPIAPSAVKVAPPKASLEPKDDWYLMPRLQLCARATHAPLGRLNAHWPSSEAYRKNKASCRSIDAPAIGRDVAMLPSFRRTSPAALPKAGAPRCYERLTATDVDLGYVLEHGELPSWHPQQRSISA